jgi:hypothetical protein
VAATHHRTRPGRGDQAVDNAIVMLALHVCVLCSACQLRFWL